MRPCVLAFCSGVAAIPGTYAKGPADLIVISGGGLNWPFEISDSASLAAFNPWTGQFADWAQRPLTDAPCFRRSVEVRFYQKWPERKSSHLDRGDLKMIEDDLCHALLLGWREGYVYLPGRAALSSFTIRIGATTGASSE